jgi:hypothetical protein
VSSFLKKTSLLALCALTAVAWADAEGLSATATVHGRILRLGSPDPIAGAAVQALEGSAAVASDEKGFYRISLPAGARVLRFSADGYAPRERRVDLASGQDRELDLSLDAQGFSSDDVIISAHRERPQVISTNLKTEEIKEVPGSGGDALRVVQSLPGVAVPDDYSSQLVIQGGGDDENLYLLDNIPWPFPFHFGGIVSTVNSDLLESVDLNGAGFGSRWGNKLGAVLEGKTRPGKKDRLHVLADISLIMTQLMVEGPLGLGDASFTLAGRRSYLDLVLKHLQAASAFTALPVFWDLGGSLDFSLGPDNHFRALALANDDLLALEVKSQDVRDPNDVGEFRLNNSAVTSGVTWVNTSVAGLRSSLSPYSYQVSVADSLGTGIDVDNQQRVNGIKEEATLAWGDKQELGFGGSFESVVYSTVLYNDGSFSFNGGQSSVPLSSTRSALSENRALYLQDRVQALPWLALTLGLHYDKSDIVGDDALEPRLSLELKSGETSTWKAAWGLYDQFPTALQLNADIGTPGLSANKAQHTVLSYEKKLGQGVLLRVDGYYKYFYDLVVADPGLEGYSNAGQGEAHGLEFFLRQDLSDRFFGWISYALSKSERLGPPGDAWSPYEYDQTNIATVVASYKMSPDWGLGMKLHYNTGPLVQSFQYRYLVSPGSYGAKFSDTYDQRLDDYLRLDLRIDRTWRFEQWHLKGYFEVLNVLGRPNPESLDYPKEYDTPPSTVDNLPRFPYFGLEFEY